MAVMEYLKKRQNMLINIPNQILRNLEFQKVQWNYQPSQLSKGMFSK